MSSTTLIEEPMRLRAGPAVSWGAILAGSAVAVALTLAIVVLGVGFGFLRGETTDGAVKLAIWLIVTQWISAAAGGFLTGRLRHRWLATHEHEVFFRDTAHGLSMWAVATLGLAVVGAGTSAMSLVDLHGKPLVGQHHSWPHEDNGPTVNRETSRPLDYEISRALRPATESSGQVRSAELSESRREIEVMVSHASVNGGLSEDDHTYLMQLIGAKTGVSADEAHRRVENLDKAILSARDAALASQKAAGKAALLAALSMLIGAFIASVAAAIGGHTRDRHT